MRRSVDRPFVELMERVYHRFKNALFDYYLGSAPAGDEETALVINNYKELIRIQDADQRLLQLVQMAAGGAGIEQVEEFASKDKELEALAKKVTELEQDVFDWKGRFSEKEEALRQFIINELHSGATIYEAIGAYNLQKHNEIITIVDKSEYQRLMTFINREDPKAFITVYNVSNMQYQPKIWKK